MILKPASEQEIVEFKSLCRKYGVGPKIEEELEAYYRQNNNFFDYYTCNDSAIFSWWEGEEQRQIWLSCLDDDGNRKRRKPASKWHKIGILS